MLQIQQLNCNVEFNFNHSEHQLTPVQDFQIKTLITEYQLHILPIVIAEGNKYTPVMLFCEIIIRSYLELHKVNPKDFANIWVFVSDESLSETRKKVETVDKWFAKTIREMI